MNKVRANSYHKRSGYINRKDHAVQGGSAGTLSVREGVPDLLGTLDFVAVQVDRRRRDRGMAEVIPYRGQLGAPCQRMGGMSVASPVRTRATQLFREHRVIRLDDFGRFRKNRRVTSHSRTPLMPAALS
jgi:hypothetical protein